MFPHTVHDCFLKECVTLKTCTPLILVPYRKGQTYVHKALGTKVILSKGGKSKVFNLTLRNKLIRIEKVSE